MKRMIALVLLLAGILAATPWVLSFWGTDNGIPAATKIIGGGDTATIERWQPTGDFESAALWWYITNIQDSVKFQVRFTQMYVMRNTYYTPWYDVYVVTTDTFSFMRLSEIPYNADSTWSKWPEHGHSDWRAIGYGGSDTDTTEVRAGLDLKDVARE